MAQSRAGAAGIWQLMPFIAHHYLPRYGDALDTRFNIILSSIAAAHLMTDNYRVMKSWDLAIAAYNSGTKHLLKTKREIGDTSSNLESIIKHSDSAHFGFASKNFYSEFLALTRVLAYKELIFPEVSAKDESFVFRFFMSKCSIKPSLAISMDTLVELKTLNHNIKDFTQTLPRGFVLVAKSDLPKQMFLEISFNDAVHIRPKEWSKLLKNQSCSTR